MAIYKNYKLKNSILHENEIQGKTRGGHIGA